MKIGILYFPYGDAYARYGKEAFAKMKAAGFSAVDYNMAETETELYTLSETELEAKMLADKKAASDADVEISQVHGPWRWPPQDATEEQRQERLEKMKRSLLATRMLGCKYWVVHPIMPYWITDLETGDAQKTWDLNLTFMQELLSYAKEQDVTICLENMPMCKFSMATPQNVFDFVKIINDEHFKICLDVGHTAVFPDLSPANAVRELGDAIKVLHIHDNMGNKDSHLRPTEGIVDWDDFGKALKEIGFNGVFSLETEFDYGLSDEELEAESIKLCDIARSIINKADL